MQVSNWLDSATKQLEAAGINSARLDCLILLEDCLKIDRSQILAHPEQELTAEQQLVVDTQLTSRLKHEPLAYIRGRTEFYGRTFTLNSSVLEPRVESETMIELLLKLDLPDSPKILDVGSGSGAIGITVALEMPSAKVDLLDIDPPTLSVARQNANRLSARVRISKGDLLKDITEVYDVLLCNLPYVPNNWQINEAAMMEPRIAIFGGDDGLDLYRQLFEQVTALETKPTYIFTECLPPQHQQLADIAKKHGFALVTDQDFIQVFKQA